MRAIAHTAGAPPAERAHATAAGRAFRAALNRFLVLPLGAVIALIWANTAPEEYFRFAQAAAFPVNEIAMAFFLALVAQELYEAMMPGAALAYWKDRSLPAIAAFGGVLGSLSCYFLFLSLKHEQMLTPAWPVVVAIDMAAAYYLLRMIYPRRSIVVSFVLLTAVLTDAIVIAVVTVQAPSFRINPAGAGLFVLALLLVAGLRRRGVVTFWPYWVTGGALSWLSFYWMGVHPALGLVPIVPFLPHDRRRGEVFADRLDDDAVHVSEHEWNVIAQIAVFLFGLANAGVMLRHIDTGSWAVVIAAVVGRPLGIVAAIFLAVLAGLRLPAVMRWTDVGVTALATTGGFTFALFIAAATLPAGAVAQQITLGALLTASGAFLTVLLAWASGAGRFATKAIDRCRRG
jgi:NhaA family Na+:H+ antiporter